MANGIALDAFLKSEQGGCCEAKDKVPDDPANLGGGVGARIRSEDTAHVEKLNAAMSTLAGAGKFDAITAKYGLTVQIITPIRRLATVQQPVRLNGRLRNALESVQ